MPGDPDPLYVRARAALLDTAAALGAHLDAIALVGAQAVYLYTGDAHLAVAEYTTDADFSIGPAELADSPLIGDLMAAAGFTPREHPGGWLSADGIYVDLMVPEALAGPGGRGARLGAHGRRVARRAKGLEAALIDRDTHTIGSLDPGDDRTVTMNVAGPGALLVAKVHKISERTRADDRVRDKDALDVFRLVQAIETRDLVDRLRRLEEHSLSAPVTREAIAALSRLFGTRDSAGTQMAIRAAGPLADSAIIAASITTLVGDLLAELTSTD